MVKGDNDGSVGDVDGNEGGGMTSFFFYCEVSITVTGSLHPGRTRPPSTYPQLKQGTHTVTNPRGRMNC